MPDSEQNDAQQLADRYVAAWNENEADCRRWRIAALWAPEGRHYTGTREAQGYDQLEQRITGSHDRNVRNGKHRFRAVPDARALRDMVTFHWEMVETATDAVIATGLEVLIVDDARRIRVDYQLVLN